MKNIAPDICGPSRVNTTGWMKFSASRIARKLIGISTTPKSAYTAEMRARAGSFREREAQHEVRRVEEEQDQEEHELRSPQLHQTPHDVFAQIEPVTSVSVPKIVPMCTAV